MRLLTKLCGLIGKLMGVIGKLLSVIGKLKTDSAAHTSIVERRKELALWQSHNLSALFERGKKKSSDSFL